MKIISPLYRLRAFALASQAAPAKLRRSALGAKVFFPRFSSGS